MTERDEPYAADPDAILAYGDLACDRSALRVPARHSRVVPLPALGPQRASARTPR